MIQLKLSPDVKNMLILRHPCLYSLVIKLENSPFANYFLPLFFNVQLSRHFLQPAASFPMVTPWQASCTCCTAFLAFATAALRRFLAVTVAILATLGEASSGEEKASHVAVGTISSAMWHWGSARNQRLTSMTDKRSRENHSWMNEWMNERSTDWMSEKWKSEWVSRMIKSKERMMVYTSLNKTELSAYSLCKLILQKRSNHNAVKRNASSKRSCRFFRHLFPTVTCVRIAQKVAN